MPNARPMILRTTAGAAAFAVAGCQPGAASATTGAATSPLANFGANDALADGTITLDEFRRAVDNRFLGIDTDADARVEPAEFAAFSDRPRRLFPRRRAAEGRGFERTDTNSDGFVSRDEFQSAAGRLFEALDTDGDGRVTPTEIRERAPGRPGRPAGGA